MVDKTNDEEAAFKNFFAGSTSPKPTRPSLKPVTATKNIAPLSDCQVAPMSAESGRRNSEPLLILPTPERNEWEALYGCNTIENVKQEPPVKLKKFARNEYRVDFSKAPPRRDTKKSLKHFRRGSMPSIVEVDIPESPLASGRKRLEVSI
jgi:hypothetical protein